MRPGMEAPQDNPFIDPGDASFAPIDDRDVEHHAREAADLAAELAARPHQDDGPHPPSHPGCLRGLFVGGTLAMETLEAVRLLVTPLYSNMATNGVQPLPKRSTTRTSAFFACTRETRLAAAGTAV